MQKLAFLDTKTTGLSPLSHEIWELAFIVREADAPRDSDQEHFFQFAPQDLADADPLALRAGRFWDRVEPQLLLKPNYVARSLSVGADEEESAWTLIEHKRAALDIAALLAGATVVACNPGFDVGTDGFLTSYLFEHGFPRSWLTTSVDTFALAYGYVLGSPPDVYDRNEVKLGMPRSALFRKLLGVIPDQRTALNSARTSRDIWDFVN